MKKGLNTLGALTAAAAITASPQESKAATLATGVSEGVTSSLTAPEAEPLGDLKYNSPEITPTVEYGTSGYDHGINMVSTVDLSGVANFDLSAYENSYNDGEINGFYLLANGQQIALSPLAGHDFVFTTGNEVNFVNGNTYTLFVDHIDLTSFGDRVHYNGADLSQIPTNDGTNGFYYGGTTARDPLFGDVALGDPAAVDMYIDSVPEPGAPILLTFAAAGGLMFRKRKKEEVESE